MRQRILNLLISFLKENFKYYQFVLVITFFFGLVFTFSDFYSNPFKNYYDFIIIFLQWFVVTVSTFGLLYLLSIHRYIFLIVFPILTAACAILAYFRFTANVSFTPMILDAALDNDLRTSLELVSLSLLLFLFICLILSLYCAFLRFKIERTFFPSHLTIAILILLFTNVLIFKIKKPVSERIPFTLFYTVEKYISEKESISTIRIDLTKEAVCNPDSLIVVLILGEALRPDHLSINGYERNTTPHLSNSNVISFPKVYSEYTYTNRSLPHILTRADSIHKNRAFEEPSFISIFNKCNFNTYWLANQESALTYAYFMHEANELHYANIHKSVYNYDKWLDGDLLPYFDAALQKKHSKKLIVMHTIGSHWWYNAHFPDSFQRFEPVVKSKIISSCTKEEIVNSYDNTILYSDFFFKQVIDKLKNKNAILIYLSDHGEALGEDNQWLHAHTNPALHQTACFIWMSPLYQTKYPSKFDAALQNADKRWRTDFLFHSILSAAEIHSPYLVEGFDILTRKKHGK